MSRIIIIIILCLTYSLSAYEAMELYKDLGVKVYHDLKPSRDRRGLTTLGYYRDDLDNIHLLKPGHYSTRAEFNHTALHELGHWTRHADRLGPIGGSYKYPDYFEEIVVDLSAMILGDYLGLPRESKDNILNYIQMQLQGQKLSHFSKELIQAEVIKTVEYILRKQVAKERLNVYFEQMHPIKV